MTRHGESRSPTDFAPLLTYLAAQQEAVVPLPLREIVRIVGTLLPDAAYTRHAFWACTLVALVGRLIAAGWRAHLRVPRRW